MNRNGRRPNSISRITFQGRHLSTGSGKISGHGGPLAEDSNGLMPVVMLKNMSY